MRKSPKQVPKGVDIRHSRACATTKDKSANCNCDPGYRPRVWDSANNRWIPGPTFNTVTEAVNWRRDSQVAVRRGQMRAPTATTVREAGEELLEGMRSGAILDRSGKPYKPATCRSYAQAMRDYVNPKLGDLRLSEVKRKHVQEYVEWLRSKGLVASTVHNKLDPIRVIFRRALDRDEVVVDPTYNLKLPAVRGTRMRIEPPRQAEALIDAAPEQYRAFWALALFAGLRRGELRALRCSDLDIKEGLVHVSRSWDDHEGEQGTKTEKGERSVPLSGRVRKELAAHLLRTGRSGDDLVFGRTAELPFIPTTVRTQTVAAWKEAGLKPLTTHEARHCAISYFVASGFDWKEATVYAGHSDVKTTYNRYAKVVPGSHVAAAKKLDKYLGQEPISGTDRTKHRTTGPSESEKPAQGAGKREYRHGDSNPGFRRERAAS
jgi:integrase